MKKDLNEDSDESDSESSLSEYNYIEERDWDNNYNSSDEQNTENEEGHDLSESCDTNDESNSADDIEETVTLESFFISLLERWIFLLLDIIMDSFQRPAEYD